MPGLGLVQQLQCPVSRAASVPVLMMPLSSDSAKTCVSLDSVARNCFWYTTYTPFQSFIEDFMGNRTEVIGVGTVQDVQHRPND
jgi:hypothetical protein